MKAALPILVNLSPCVVAGNPISRLIGMIMDWREMAGRPTVREMQTGEKWWAWSGGKRIGYGWKDDQWDGRIDPIRGWIIAFCWLVACSAE
jgi:protein SYS1